MKKLTVTNQEELDAAISEAVFTKIILDGCKFVLLVSAKMHDLEFVGKQPNTMVFLTGVQTHSLTEELNGYSDSQNEMRMVNQFNTVFSATCKNLTVTSENKLELYFQTEDEFKAWENVEIDENKINAVIFTEEIDKSLDTGPKTLAELKNDLNEITIDFLEGVKQDCSDLTNSLS